MSRLIRLDQTGHTELAQWSSGDLAAFDGAQAALRRELQRGYFAVASRGRDGTGAEQVRELPIDADLVIPSSPTFAGARARTRHRCDTTIASGR